MMSTMTVDSIALQQLVYTWAEQTLTGPGNGVVLRSSAWPTGNSIVTDPALADFVEYIPAKYQHRLGNGTTPPLGVDFWVHPVYGHVVAVHRYLGVDSAGREGRSIVHVLLDPERRLDVHDALDLSHSQLITTDWPLQASPVADAAKIIYRPGTGTDTNDSASSTLIKVVLAGVLENLQGKRPIVFTHADDVDTTALLREAFRRLPRNLTTTMTFSTYRGIPQRAKCEISFATTSFSEILPKADLQRTYVPLTTENLGLAALDSQPDEVTNISAQSVELAEALLQHHAVNGSVFPPDIRSIAALTQWIRFQSLANQPAESLSISDCETLLALPAETSWVKRQDIIEKMAQVDGPATADSTTSYTDLLTSDELEDLGHTLHTNAAAELTTSARRALQLKHRADAMGFPAKRLADLSIPIIERLSTTDGAPFEADLAQYVAEIVPLVPHDRRLEWAGRRRLQDALLRQWEPTARSVADRTWKDPEWARLNIDAAMTVARRYPKQSAEVIAKALADSAINTKTIDQVVKLAPSPSDSAFRDVVEVLFRLPGTGRYQPYRPPAREYLPAPTYSQVQARDDFFVGSRYERPLPAASTAAYFRPTNPWTPTTRETNGTFLPYGSNESAGAAEKRLTFEAEPRQLDAAHRRMILRIIGGLISAAAGYSVAATNWSPFVWPSALFLLLCSTMIMILPVKPRWPNRRPKPSRPRRFLWSPKRRTKGLPPI